MKRNLKQCNCSGEKLAKLVDAAEKEIIGFRCMFCGKIYPSGKEETINCVERLNKEEIQSKVLEDILKKTEACENYFHNKSCNDSCEGCGYFYICSKSPYFDLSSSSPKPSPFNPAAEYNEIAQEMSRVYRAKNEDYGDAFAKSIQKHGLIAAVVRIEDKISRIKNLTKGNTDLKVKSESIEDTLLDLANYSILTMLEITSNNEDKYQRHERLTSEMSIRYESKFYSPVNIQDAIKVVSSMLEDIIPLCHEFMVNPSDIVRFQTYLVLLDIADYAIEIIIELRKEKFNAAQNNNS